MTQRHSLGRQERFVRRYDYDDRTVLAADLPAGDVSVDVVDGTAIVVTDRDSGVEEFEFDLPGPAATVDTHNGVLTIGVDK
ncbi:DUF7127 family protein [Candidatus Halobonum tyrrellensis]|uniref:Hsp20/alpha crystallin family protein n=1 Tax=Candidatus Halobonum tyrrellensis G22 TaxID=1324957 RepID=V4HG39_9EURY|nr:hypothetical protein [Candidatus Halobonum tyrrellensis]ESP89083.1 hypothetical protein K933_05748 [Candidatus Halobonum tyrrellensis G22]